MTDTRYEFVNHSRIPWKVTQCYGIFNQGTRNRYLSGLGIPRSHNRKRFPTRFVSHARTMTTRIYVVAYPHPSLRPRHRVSICEVDSQTFMKGLRSQLYEEYPDHIEDLKRATFWKVSRCL